MVVALNRGNFSSQKTTGKMAQELPGHSHINIALAPNRKCYQGSVKK